jgi:hypothetical protein
MRHPNDGALRRLVDDPVGVADADREHVAGCPVCLAELAATQQDADIVAAALDVDGDVDTDAGWRRLSDALAADRRRRGASTPRRRATLRSPAVAVVGVVALIAGAAAAAAADWLPIFRTEQLTPVVAPRADLVKLPELDDFGELTITEELDVREVADAAAAQAATGLAVPTVSTRPQGVSGEPTYLVGRRTSAVFTFSTAKAARFAEAAGQTLPPPPPGLEGSQFRLVAGPGIAAVWSENRPVPAMIVGRVVAPVAYSASVPFEVARDYLLSLPMLPKDIAEQLRGFAPDGTTLPLFVTAEQTTSTATDVGGVPATLLAARNGLLAAVVWVDNGIITAVAGSMSADEVLSVARGLGR